MFATAGDALDFDLAAWPPGGAEPATVEGGFDGFAVVSLGSAGPAFQGLCAAWRLGDEMYAEVALSGEAVDGFGLPRRSWTSRSTPPRSGP